MEKSAPKPPNKLRGRRSYAAAGPGNTGPRRFYPNRNAMVKLQGPALSLGAAGSIGDGMTISNWKGRHYLKKKTKPADPHSPAQVAQRAMMAFLSKVWPTLSDGDRATWTNVARPQKVPPYNAFLGYNLSRLHTVKGPSKRYPAAEEGALAVIAGGEPNCTNAIHSIHTNFWFKPAHDAWGYLILSRPEPGDPPDLTNLLYMGLADADPNENIHIIQRPPGFYRQTARLFSDDGIMGDMKNQITATSLPYG